MECFTQCFDFDDETKAIFISATIFIFNGIFGYAYCTRDLVESDSDSGNNSLDPNNLSNKEKIVFKKMTAEIEPTKKKLNDMEDKMLKYFPEAGVSKEKEALKKVPSLSPKKEIIDEVAKKSATKVEDSTKKVDTSKKVAMEFSKAKNMEKAAKSKR